MGFTPRESYHPECGGVYISANPITLTTEEFISLTPNTRAKKSKSKPNRHQIPSKKSNREKNHNCHITIKMAVQC